MSTFLQDVMAQAFITRGADEAMSRALAELSIKLVLAMGVASERAVDQFEIEAKIYHLRGKGMRPCDLMRRFGMSRASIFRILRLHMRRRREAIRLGTGMVA